MADIRKEIERRRTFAIISHPDAGKTTLTEKLLLYGGAIQLAGSVKGKATARHAVSDWMELEKQRGISISSSVMQFEYNGYCINILDTPGHQDFSEDTYRTLMAADSAVMVIDAAKGIEPQTRKLFKICAMRNIPIFTFINKLDREARSPYDLMEELEQEIGANLIGRFRGTNYDGQHPFSPGHLLPILEHIRDNRDFYRVYLSQSTAQHRLDWAFGKLLEWYVRPLLRGLSIEEEAIAYYFAFFRAGFLALIQQWLQNRCQEEPEVILSYVQNLLRLSEIEGEQV